MQLHPQALVDPYLLAPAADSPIIQTFYRVDRNDVTVEAGGQWDEFALSNDGANLLAQQVISTPLVRPYRCDSPACKRFMQFKAEPLHHVDYSVCDQCQVEFAMVGA